MAGKQIFDGVKIADFSWVIVGPTIVRELAEHGATVVHVESHRYPDTGRVIGPFKDNKPSIDSSAWWAIRNANKYGVSLDLSKPKGQEIAKKLVKWADIVGESMAPGAMAKFGLDYESCKKVKSDIIYFSTCQFGQHGPLASYAGYGQLGAAYSGFSYVLGQPGKAPPQLYNNYPDFIAPPYMVTALVAALLYRRKTGKGVYLDESQVEAGATFLGPAILDYAVNGRVAERMGSRDPYMVPHGIYPCRGDDRWLAVAVSNEKEWQALVTAIDKPDWSKESRFSTATSRKESADELDSLIASWTLNYTPEQAMQLFQDADVPAGIVATGEDLLNDPQLKYRKHYVFMEHTFIGKHAYHAPAFRLSKTPHYIWKAAPCLGEDNFYVYKEILGLSENEISDLMAEGVITTEADLAAVRPYR